MVFVVVVSVVNVLFNVSYFSIVVVVVVGKAVVVILAIFVLLDRYQANTATPPGRELIFLSCTRRI